MLLSNIGYITTKDEQECSTVASTPRSLNDEDIIGEEQDSLEFRMLCGGVISLPASSKNNDVPMPVARIRQEIAKERSSQLLEESANKFEDASTPITMPQESGEEVTMPWYKNKRRVDPLGAPMDINTTNWTAWRVSIFAEEKGDFLNNDEYVCKRRKMSDQDGSVCWGQEDSDAFNLCFKKSPIGARKVQLPSVRAKLVPALDETLEKVMAAKSTLVEDEAMAQVRSWDEAEYNRATRTAAASSKADKKATKEGEDEVYEIEEFDVECRTISNENVSDIVKGVVEAAANNRFVTSLAAGITCDGSCARALGYIRCEDIGDIDFKSDNIDIPIESLNLQGIKGNSIADIRVLLAKLSSANLKQLRLNFDRSFLTLWDYYSYYPWMEEPVMGSAGRWNLNELDEAKNRLLNLFGMVPDSLKSLNLSLATVPFHDTFILHLMNEIPTELEHFELHFNGRPLSSKFCENFSSVQKNIAQVVRSLPLSTKTFRCSVCTGDPSAKPSEFARAKKEEYVSPVQFRWLGYKVESELKERYTRWLEENNPSKKVDEEMEVEENKVILECEFDFNYIYEQNSYTNRIVHQLHKFQLLSDGTVTVNRSEQEEDHHMVPVLRQREGHIVDDNIGGANGFGDFRILEQFATHMGFL